MFEKKARKQEKRKICNKQAQKMPFENFKYKINSNEKWKTVTVPVHIQLF